MLASNLLTPCWHHADALQLSSAEHDWLFNQDSLTQRLSHLSQGQFSVRPLHERWQPLRHEESALLGVPAHSEGWVREVYLCGAEQPWVFARSIATRQGLAQAQFDLSTLGSRSLGELLFQDSAFSRGPLLACVYPERWLPAEIQQPNLWGRRSCFSRDGLSVLVAEVFLPAFWQTLRRENTPQNT